VADYSRALQIEPANATALHNRGSLFERLGRCAAVAQLPLFPAPILAVARYQLSVSYGHSRMPHINGRHKLLYLLQSCAVQGLTHTAPSLLLLVCT
jgi:hypothetical protein